MPTFTPTPIPQCDEFYVSKNLFVPSQGAVSMYVAYCSYPGPYSLKVYNTAGEFIRDLSADYHDPTYLNNPIMHPYFWNGTNYGNNPCASGIYILYLVEPFDRKIKSLVLVR
jgi:hypothetical protein